MRIDLTGFGNLLGLQNKKYKKMKTKINRRKFIQNSALGSMGMFIAPSLTSASSIFTAANEGKNVLMAGLTPISIIDNACMLAYCSGKLSLASQEVVTTDIHFIQDEMRGTPGNKGRLAVVMPPLDKKLIELVKTIKSDTNTKHIKAKRAISFGWAGVNAVHKNINPALEGKSPEDALKMRLHQDALVIKGFSSPEHHVEGASYQDVEDMLNAIQVRTITRVHTLKPDSDDGIGWVNRMALWRKKNIKIMEQFAKAIVSPDENVAGKSFYNFKEEIITSANRLQKAENVKQEKIMALLNKGVQSHYANALAEATHSIFAIDAYLEGKISERDLADKLNLS